MTARIDIEKLNRDPALVAQIASAEEVFSFLNRQVAVPATCVGLIYGESNQPTVAHAGRIIQADGLRELLLVRTVGFELDYRFDGLPSKDGYDFSATACLTVQPVPERTELEAFRRNVLGSHREVRKKRLQQHCEEVVRESLAAFTHAQQAEDLLSPETWRAFDAILKERFKAVGFESGLALGSDPRVTFESHAYVELQRRQEAASLRGRRREEDQRVQRAAAEAREKHLAEVQTLLKKVKAMADDNGVLKVPELIKTFDAAQRGRLYHGLLTTETGTRRRQTILVVSGGELLWFDPSDLQKIVRRSKLSKDAGALRSVRLAGDVGKRQILMGARYGVHVMDVDSDQILTCVLADPPKIRGGFNAATLVNEQVYATHSELGLIRWSLDKPNVHEACLSEFTEGSKSVRDVQIDATGRLWLSVDNLVVGWQPERDDSTIALQAPAEVSVLQEADGFLIAGLRDGAIVRWLIGDHRRMETVRAATGAPIRSLAWLGGGGVPRLLIGDGRPYLDLLVLGDSYHGEYRCMHELRWGFATDDLIVGVNDRRDHLFCWRADMPESPRTACSVGRLTGHSIQDAALMADPRDNDPPSQSSATI